MRELNIVKKIGLILLGVMLCMILLEVGLRAGGAILLAWQHRQNEKKLHLENTYRVLCLGESTTAQGGDTSYPKQLESILNASSNKNRFVVFNEGVIGTTSRFILKNLPYKLAKYTPDMVIIMMGVNDETREGAHSDGEKRPNVFNTLRVYKLVKLLILHLRATLRWGIKDSLQPVSEIETASDECPPDVRGRNKLVIEKPEVMTLLKKGDVCHNNQEYEKAIALYEQALTIDPHSYHTYVKLAVTYQAKQDEKKSHELFESAIALNPEQDLAYVLYGESYLNLAYYKKNEDYFSSAKRLFETAKEKNPNIYIIYDRLAQCNMHLKQYADAAEILREGLQRYPEDHRYLKLLINVFEAQGASDKADAVREAILIENEYQYNEFTKNNYSAIIRILLNSGIVPVCVQYPLRSIKPLKELLREYDKEVVFVDNERIFNNALQQGSYDEYFDDRFAGDFGHCTEKGNRLLAQNIADTILKGTAEEDSVYFHQLRSKIR